MAAHGLLVLAGLGGVVGGCITPAAKTGLLSIVVEVDPTVRSELEPSHYQATLTGMRRNDLTWPLDEGSNPLPVEAGRYQLTIWVVHRGDARACQVGPVASNNVPCQNALASLASCSAVVDVVAGATVQATYRYLPGDHCALVAQ
jgi:hypothetical protein